MSDVSSSPELPPPDRYQSFIEEVELRGARLVSCDVKSSQMVHDASQASYEIDVETTFNRYDNGFEAIQDCTVSFFVLQDDDELPIGHVQVAYGLGYTCAFEDEEYDIDAYLRIFEQVSLPVNSWPFIRQFVHDMTQRMNWPPLMLPLLKPDSDAPADDGADTEG